MTRTPFHSRESYPVWQSIDTRWSDNDMYGHVNNVVYYSWFDSVVNRWLIEAGLLTLQDDPLIGLVVQSSCRYASSLEYPQTIEIGLATERVGNSSVTYRLGAFAKGEVQAAAEGQFTHVYVDAASRRPVTLPDDWRNALARLAPREPA